MVSSGHNLISGNIATHNSRGLYLDQAANKIIGNNFSFNTGSGILAESTSAASNISANICVENGRSGMELNNPMGATINENVCVGNDKSGIILGPQYAKLDGEARGNTCTLNGEDGIYVFGLSLEHFGWFWFDRNNCSSNGGDGISLLFANGNTLTNNTCADNGGSGIVLAGSLGNTVSENECSRNLGIGLLLERVVAHETWNPDYNLISENWICSNSGVGLSIFAGREDEVVGNLVRDNLKGIVLDSCSYAWIDGNELEGNNREAICITNSLHTTLRNNTMLGEGVYLVGVAIQFWALQDIDESNTANGNPVYYFAGGVGEAVPSGLGQVILADCKWMTVENQSICDTSVGVQLGYCENITVQYNALGRNINGVRVVSSYYCSFFRNNISASSAYGLVIESGTMNSIWDNTFWYNSGSGTVFDANCVQAADDGSRNRWNASSTGNWWTDWQDPDGDADGIVDIPYAIDGLAESQDFYPLTTPYEPIPEFSPALLVVLLAMLIVVALSRERRNRR
jgi:parallel beta-helix repeat protein